MKKKYSILFTLLISCFTSHLLAQTSPTMTCPVDVVVSTDLSGCFGTATFVTPVATDPDGGPVMVTQTMGLPSGSISFPLGNTTIEFTADDGIDPVTTCTFIVTVEDNENPIIDTSTLADITDVCSVDTSTLAIPTATDNCAGSLNGTTPSITITTKGTTVIVWTYDDGNGNTATQNQNVIITDSVDPVADAGALGDFTTQCSVDTSTLTAPTATDNCAGSIAGTTPATMITTQGTTMITWTYDDGNGNTSTQTQNIVIDDTTDPTPDLAKLPIITGQCEVTSLTAPTATDNCGGTVTVTHDATLPISGEGTTIVTWTYDDGNGNTSTQTQEIVIDDTTDPVADAASLGNVTEQCSVDTSALTAPTATDTCAGAITGTTPATIITTQGTTMITWTYDDGNGNTATQTQDIVIDDTTNPSPDATTLTDITAECAVTSLTDPTATDNCGGTVTVSHNATLPISGEGTTTVTWTYDDGNGNTSTQTQNIVIDDITGPTPDVATLPNIMDECSVDTSTLTAPTAYDNCGATGIVGTTSSLTINAQGTTVIIWTYDDGNGNTSTQNQNIVIDDTTDPIPDLATLPAITGQCEVTSLTAPTATDNCGGTVMVTHDATLPITSEGTIVNVTWTYDDGNGNTITQMQTVTIDDTTDPVADAASLGNVTDECSVDTSTLTAPTATDICAGAITGTTPAAIITTQGTTMITWSYNDGNGNTSTQTQNIVIDDVTPPTTVALLDIVAECEVTTLASPTATDNCGGPIIISHNATLPITMQGTTVVTWTFTDENNNMSTQTQNVIINDNTAPIITCPANQMAITDPGVCDVVVAFGDAVATDNCSVSVVQTAGQSSGSKFAVGVHLIEFTATDSGGNTATCSFTITVEDNEAPLASCKNITVGLDASGNATITPADIDDGSSDNCMFTLSLDTTSFTCADIGSNSVTLTVTDSNMNTDSCIAVVTVEDTVNPVITNCPVDFTAMADVSGNYTILDYSTLTFSDNCTANANLATVQSPVAGTVVGLGITTVSFTVTDSESNSAICTFDITVDPILGITDTSLNESNVSLYPNPSSNYISIETGNIPLTSASIFDLRGRLLKSINFDNVQEYKVDVSNLENAQYFVRLKSEAGTVTKRFIKN